MIDFRRAALPVFALLCVTATPAAAAPAAVGKPAPGFTVTTMDKHQVKLADLKGKVIVINHWATWCGPCKAEMPMMSAFHRRYKDSGFEIFGVTTDDSAPPSALKDLARVLSYPLARTFNGRGYPTLGGVPTTYVIDRKGVVRYARSGSFDAERFGEIVLPLLRESAE